MQAKFCCCSNGFCGMECMAREVSCQCTRQPSCVLVHLTNDGVKRQTRPALHCHHHMSCMRVYATTYGVKRYRIHVRWSCAPNGSPSVIV